MSIDASKIPVSVLQKLQGLDNELHEGDITLKGYCKRKWSLLQDYVPLQLVAVMKQMHDDLSSKEKFDNQIFCKIHDLLKLKNNEMKGKNEMIKEVTEEKIVYQLPSNLMNSLTDEVKANTEVSFQLLKNPLLEKVTGTKLKNFETKDSVVGIKTIELNAHYEVIRDCHALNADLQTKNQIQSNAKKRKKLNENADLKKSNADEVKNINKRKKLNKNTLKKLNTDEVKENVYKGKKLTETNDNLLNGTGQCFVCSQTLGSILFFSGFPNGAMDEFVALTDPRLLLFTGQEEEVDSFDKMPHNKITQFSIYDEHRHMCPIDAGLIENNALLYFSGYLKPIYSEDLSTKGGVPTKDLGPINEWWIAGYDGGESALVGLSTAYGEYYLMEPSAQYEPLMRDLQDKMYLCKVVIEFLNEGDGSDRTYEDLLVRLRECGTAKGVAVLDEEKLLRHAQFICDQVTSFDAAASISDPLLIRTECMRILIELAGVTLEKRRVLHRLQKRRSQKTRKCTKATTTDLVREIFEAYFPEQLDREKTIRRKRCGMCAVCQLPDCGVCVACRDKVKFGGKGKGKHVCTKRHCPNMALDDVSEADLDSDVTNFLSAESVTQSHLNNPLKILHQVQQISEPIHKELNRTYYNEALVGSTVVRTGDNVLLYVSTTHAPPLVARVVSIWRETDAQVWKFHARFYCRGFDTILGEISDPFELFAVDECCDCALGAIMETVNVVNNKNSNDTTFFCCMRYVRDRCRFEDLRQVNIGDEKLAHCESCRAQEENKMAARPRFQDGVLYWRNEQYKSGCGVYLVPKTFNFDTVPLLKSNKNQKADPVNEELYPELYRKKSDNTFNVNGEEGEPFCIGYVLEVLKKCDKDVLQMEDIYLNVQKLYRPENTHKGNLLAHQVDLNFLYWSEEQATVDFLKVAGRCHIVFGDAVDMSPEDWFHRGPNRFYFTECYNAKTKEFHPFIESTFYLGRRMKSENKGKIENNFEEDSIDEWPKMKEPLRTMDVFAGCGGFSEGLRQSGVADVKWAIENDKSASQAFKLNHPDTVLYTEDCNSFLSLALSGAVRSFTGNPLPSRDAIDLLCGGPPCQGFSGMNRFSSGRYSWFKNSLVVTYLSFCDFYRPRFFVLENVRNFVFFKRSIVLKLTLKCLLAMGYQCAIGIMQAGCYGVPQNRRRLIILAAAPGEVLPQFPEPIHAFPKRTLHCNIVIDNCRYTTGSRWLGIGAPYRTITVRDAMSDLPEISNGSNILERSYNTEPLTHFQRYLRHHEQEFEPVLRDHICKEMAPIVVARISHIPIIPGADWRDLPNLIVQLSDGTFTNKLRYDYDDEKNGVTRNGKYRGVCPCASRQSCPSAVRQYNTLIPWCLPHTANRHNQWAGVYGRLEWDDIFRTTVTNPEPMGRQGCIIHPEQHRVVSVRECARSQGFSDGFKFFGNVMDKHRQVGNAVPPPMGCAIGREILRAAIAKVEE